MNQPVYPWQHRQWSRLSEAFERGRLPHALLLAGPSGLGLEQFASNLAAKWLCAAPNDGYACGLCRSCQLFESGNHPDISRIEPEETGKQIKVDAIRELIHFIQLSSQYARGKIAIIDPAEAMNRSSANSLLKILEEPPAGSVFLLISHQPALLPVTVRSRCQRLDFAPVYDEAAVDWLESRTGMARTVAADTLLLSRGRPLEAIAMTENNTIQQQQQLLAELARLDNANTDVSALAHRWQDLGAGNVFAWLGAFLATMTRLKLAGVTPADGSSQLNRDLQRLANRLDLRALLGGYDLAIQNYRYITGPYNLNQTGLLEQFIVYWQSINGNNGGRKA